MKLYNWGACLLVAGSVGAYERSPVLAPDVRGEVSAPAAVVPVRLTARAPSTASMPGEYQRQAAEDTLTAGCHGGRTGGGAATEVTRHGQFRNWHRLLPSDPRHYDAIWVDSASARAVFAEVERVRLRSVAYRKGDNATCYLELTGPLGTHTVSWASGQPPAAVRHLYELVRGLGHPDG